MLNENRGNLGGDHREVKVCLKVGEVVKSNSYADLEKVASRASAASGSFWDFQKSGI